MYGTNVPRQAFIKDALIPLQVDAARGEGEYLRALAQLSGCPSEQQEEFAQVMHGNFETLFMKQDGAEQLLNRIDLAARGSENLRTHCLGIN